MAGLAPRPLAVTLPPEVRTLIEPRQGWHHVDLAEVWRHRDLLLLLALRDIRVRYKQTVLGAAWAILQPLVTMIVLSVVFGRLLGLNRQVGDVPYPVFLYAGLLPWTFFAAAVSAASNSLVNNANLLGKVYFPRLVMPLAAQGAPMVDYAVSAVVLLVLMIVYGVSLSAQWMLLPLLVLTTVAIAMGVGVSMAALIVTYRDFRFVLPFLLQTWFFVTPVIAPGTVLPSDYAWLLHLNPLAGVLEAFRAAVLGTPVPYLAWAVSVGWAVLLLGAGLLYFGRTERRFADLV